MIQLDAPSIVRPARHFIPESFEFRVWADIEPFWQQLSSRDINSAEALNIWLRDRSELESFMSENGAWRYINYTRHTDNTEYVEAYQFYISEIQPQAAPYSDALNRKFIASAYTDSLKDEASQIYIRRIKRELDLYREENIPLYTRAEEEAKKYADLVSQMTIHYKDEEITLSQAAKYLKDSNREVRKEVYEKISARRLRDREQMDIIFNELVRLRTQIAVNAGYKDYRDYKFDALDRFDYTIEDVHSFHESVIAEVVPLVKALNDKKKAELKLDIMRPYDQDAEPEGQQPLHPYKTSEELITKAITSFSRLHPRLGEYISTMNSQGYMDLDSRKGKAPGGYNYPLDETGIPFIFMNASGKFRDLVTMFHEGGHAVHSFLTRNLMLNAFKHTPSEVAELASMSMELISMDCWDEFFSDKEELRRAKKEQLESVIDTLPWINLVDKFQNWIYTHPEHQVNDRTAEWVKEYEEFYPLEVDWTGYEDFRAISWQKQLHIFEVPFYYIEYGIAQLGALAVWRNYKQNPEKGLESYLNALKLGYTRSVPEIYKEAGIHFDFSREYIRELMAFVREELDKLETEA